jgi:hypothetical protein
MAVHSSAYLAPKGSDDHSGKKDRDCIDRVHERPRPLDQASYKSSCETTANSAVSSKGEANSDWEFKQNTDGT